MIYHEKVLPSEITISFSHFTRILKNLAHMSAPILSWFHFNIDLSPLCHFMGS